METGQTTESAGVNNRRAALCHHCQEPIPRGQAQRYLGHSYHFRCATIVASRPKETAVEFDEIEFDDLETAMVEETSPPVTALVAPPRTGQLMSDPRQTQRVTRFELDDIIMPPATDTFQPIAHSQLVDSLEEALAFRHISIVQEEFAVSPDGMKLFGLLELNADFEGVRFAIGLRNANDKSMRLGLVAGYKVFVCSNMAFMGEFHPLLAKHTKHFDLIESVSIGVDRIQRGFAPLRQAIATKRRLTLTDDAARVLIYRAFMEEKFPVTQMKAVHQHYFHPHYADFSDRTLWSLENAFTESFKELLPVRQYEVTARLGRFLQPFVAGAPVGEGTL